MMPSEPKTGTGVRSPGFSRNLPPEGGTTNLPPEGGTTNLPPQGGTTNAVPFSELTGLLTLLCDGEMGQAEWERLEALLLNDPAAQDFYRRFIGVDVDLAWRAAKVRGDVQEISKSEVPDQQVPVGAAVELLHQLGESLEPQPETIVPPIIIDSSRTIHYPLFTIHSPLGAWLFSYAAATVITGMAILGAWVYKVSHDYQLAASLPAAVRPAEKNTGTELEVVGRIAGALDCQCSDLRAVAPVRRSLWAAGTIWPPGCWKSAIRAARRSFSRGRVRTKWILPLAASSRWAS